MSSVNYMLLYRLRLCEQARTWQRVTRVPAYDCCQGTRRGMQTASACCHTAYVVSRHQLRITLEKPTGAANLGPRTTTAAPLMGSATDAAIGHISMYVIGWSTNSGTAGTRRSRCCAHFICDTAAATAAAANLCAHLRPQSATLRARTPRLQVAVTTSCWAEVSAPSLCRPTAR